MSEQAEQSKTYMQQKQETASKPELKSDEKFFLLLAEFWSHLMAGMYALASCDHTALKEMQRKNSHEKWANIDVDAPVRNGIREGMSKSPYDLK